MSGPTINEKPKMQNGLSAWCLKYRSEILASALGSLLLVLLQRFFKTLSNARNDFLSCPVSMQAALLILVFAVAGLLYSRITLARSVCSYYDSGLGKCSFGLMDIVTREEMSGTDVMRMASDSYEWVGLSANNEVAQTPQQDAIAAALKKGKQFSFILLDPDDPLRTREQANWEKVGENKNENKNIGYQRSLSSPKDLRKNIRNSIDSLKELAKTGNLSFHIANRIPWLRVIMIDGSIFHIGHYNEASCGYESDALIFNSKIFGPKSVFKPSWLRHFVKTEHKNAIIDDIYAALVRYYCHGYRDSNLANMLLNSDRCAGLREDFQKHFSWKLDHEAINESIKFVIDRFGLNAIDEHQCPYRKADPPTCALGVHAMIPKGKDVSKNVCELEKSMVYLGATAYYPINSILSSTLSDRILEDPSRYELRFLINQPGAPALKAAQLLFGRRPDLVPNGYIEKHEELLRIILGRLKNSPLSYCDIIPSFRIINIDERTLHVSFYISDKAIMNTPVLVLQNAVSNPEKEINLYHWFSEHAKRTECTAALWEIEREIWSKWVAGQCPKNDEENISAYMQSAWNIFGNRCIKIEQDTCFKLTAAIIQNVSDFHKRRTQESTN